MRVQAVWKPAGERDVTNFDNRQGGDWEHVIERWEPTGEPDVDPARLKEYVVLSTTRSLRPCTRRRHRGDVADAQLSPASTDPSPRSSCGASTICWRKTGLERKDLRVHHRRQLRLPVRACRSPSCPTSTASARGRRSTRATSRWTRAWALHEAWLRLMLGDIDVALVIGSGKSSPGRPREVFPLQTDPYVDGAARVRPVSLAGIQARAPARRRTGHRARLRRGRRPQPPRRARRTPTPRWRWTGRSTSLLAEPYFSAPLRRHDLPPISDGAAAVVIAAGDRARRAWRSTDHPAPCGSGAWTIGSSRTIPACAT